MEVEGKNPYTLLVETQNSIATMEITMGALQKQKIELPYDLSVPLLSIYVKECMSAYKRFCTLMFIAALLTISELGNQLWCQQMHKGIKKKYIYIYICKDT
jgi:hypothetical protein